MGEPVTRRVEHRAPWSGLSSDAEDADATSLAALKVLYEVFGFVQRTRGE